MSESDPIIPPDDDDMEDAPPPVDDEEQQDQPEAEEEEAAENEQSDFAVEGDEYAGDDDAQGGEDLNTIAELQHRLSEAENQIQNILAWLFNLLSPEPDNCTTTGVTTIGAAAEGSDTADTASWDRETDKTPVEVWLVRRSVYNDAGDEVLYSFVNKLKFDTCGRLTSISGETKVTVDTPETCS